ncbi:helix-turn-helix domain-containing protein [Burkholderia pseudomallei]|uniref:helix-turn-helix domain-containing protein n=1 Tax=Burkholderia pseudomallei TaxID=28450 RepID=UPI000F0759EE|nr:helix-turn-helix domain-containing protein [Burkholderia pseudomallei]CAJ2771238.1 Uncharacterised protein [Burkholderia pseudomallei]VCK79725.1 Uncharacterised protein [Burkholderia pseudomallei]VCK80571.1 Uncharacterised protein [Burkholderia pseudomallei]VCK80818.1 Uncharacterised protein [Burkholderia pseudomallei]VCK91483.1 Uncharacterised protein [Burkholderia pseudomallei]
MGSQNERVLQELTTLEKALRILDGLPDDAPLTAAMAAVFLGVSERTLMRLRSSGDGPPYAQYPDRDTFKRNQRVNYILKDLRDWRASKRVKSTVEAAAVRGLTFTTRAAVFDDEHPFWAQRLLDGERPTGAPQGATLRLVGHALRVPEARFRELLDASLAEDATVELVHLTLSQAMSEAWVSSVERAPLHRAYLAALAHEAAAEPGRQEAIELAEVTGTGQGGGGGSGGAAPRPPRRPGSL